MAIKITFVNEITGIEDYCFVTEEEVAEYENRKDIRILVLEESGV